MIASATRGLHWTELACHVVRVRDFSRVFGPWCVFVFRLRESRVLLQVECMLIRFFKASLLCSVQLL